MLRGLLREDTPLLPARHPFLSSVTEMRVCFPREASLHQNGTSGEQSSQGCWFPFEGVLLFASRYGCLGALCDRRALSSSFITSLELQVRQQLEVTLSSSFC